MKEAVKENLRREAARSCSGILTEDKRGILRETGRVLGKASFICRYSMVMCLCRGFSEFLSFLLLMIVACSCCTFPLNLIFLVSGGRDLDVTFNFDCAYQVLQTVHEFGIASRLICT